LKETQRSFLYFSLYKMCIDAIVMNRILPGTIEDKYFHDWKESQRRYLELAEEYFNPVPIFPVVLFQNEPLGLERLKRFGEDIYGDRDPTEHFYTERPYEFSQKDGKFFIKIKLPFLTKEEVELNRLPEEMVIRVGGFKKHILLPRYVSTYKDVTAKIEGTYLNIIFGGKNDGKEKSQR